MSVQLIQKETRQVIMSAVEKIVGFISPTFGPSANKAIVDKNMWRHVVDDGVQICRDLELSDPAENAVLKLVREVAIKTNDRVGDGTTSSLIILRAIMQEVEKRGLSDGRKISEELKKACTEAVSQLTDKSKKITTQEEIEQVARISFNDDKTAKMIAELLHKVGKEGVIKIETSNAFETESEHTDGLEIPSGYVSPYMITNAQRMEAELNNNPYIVLTSYRVTNLNDLKPILDKMIKEGKRECLILADNVEQQALQFLVTNFQLQTIRAVAVSLPQGVDKLRYLEDIALLTGGNVFTQEKGNILDTAETHMLGRAESISIKQNSTIIKGSKGSKTLIDQEKQAIKNKLKDNLKDSEKDALKMRLALLGNGVAVIKVGAPTENEAKALKYKVEDAVHSTRSAVLGGVVCGAGLALAQVNTSSDILNRALKHPHKQLLENLGIESLNLGINEAYNAVTGETGDYLKVGVIDPVEVLIAGIESAVSIASLLLTSYGLLIEVPEDNKK